MTYSAGIRKELIDRSAVPSELPARAMVSFAAFSAVSGTVEAAGEGWLVTLRVTGAYLSRMVERMGADLSFPLRRKKTGKRDVSLTFFVPGERRASLFFDFDHWWEVTSEQGLEPVFAAFYLACGVMSDPSTGRYRLAFAPFSDSAIPLMTRLFGYAGFVPGQSRHQGKRLLILSNGDDIARFLLLCGAHHALLTFEERRSEHELLGQVNRMVNFDEANTNRRAQSISGQLQAIVTIERLRGLDSLPQALAEAAKARLKHRGASLEELGAGMSPPVSKSGMSHRFAKLRAIARLLESKQTEKESKK